MSLHLPTCLWALVIYTALVQGEDTAQKEKNDAVQITLVDKETFL